MRRYLYRLLFALISTGLSFFLILKILDDFVDKQLDKSAQIQEQAQEKLRLQQLEKQKAEAVANLRMKEQAALEQERRRAEYAFEKAFDAWYQAPEGCHNWRSYRHMVECVQHKMTAKSQFKTTYQSRVY